MYNFTLRKEAESSMAKTKSSNCETSSKKMGTLASKVLSNPNSSKSSKSLAASVLTQRPNHGKGKK
jgi:hypothetical protein